MTHRDQILDAMRRGARTSGQIIKATNLKPKSVYEQLVQMRELGAVASTKPVGGDRPPGRPGLIWHVVEDYVPHKLPVPAWVKRPDHKRVYRAIARYLDDDTAARWARAAKQQAPA